MFCPTVEYFGKEFAEFNKKRLENIRNIINKIENILEREINKGIRALAIHCYMALGEFNNILKFCSTFPNDTMPETMYGRVYALNNLEKLEEAEIALKEVLYQLPLVAKELISTKHKLPVNNFTNNILVGSKEEGIEYWNRIG